VSGHGFWKNMNRADLEEALRAAGEIAREREFIVFGSQAVLGLLARPPKTCLASSEVDLYPRHNVQAVNLLVAKLGSRSDFSRRSGYFVDCVSPELAMLPDGWMERLVPFCTSGTGGVTGWCLEIHDLAVSKLAAGRPKDLRYVLALMRERCVSTRVIERRIACTPATAAEKGAMRMRLRALRAKKHTRKPK
jgi:hypothetical protein